MREDEPAPYREVTLEGEPAPCREVIPEVGRAQCPVVTLVAERVPYPATVDGTNVARCASVTKTLHDPVSVNVEVPLVYVMLPDLTPTSHLVSVSV